MLLEPRKYKFSKTHSKSVKLYSNTKASRSNSELAFGSIGVIAKNSGYVTVNQVESLRKVFSRFGKKSFKIWIRLRPYIAQTGKPSEARMGKGRGKTVAWVLFVKKGQVLFEFDGKGLDHFFTDLKAVNSKVSIKLGIIKHEH